MRTNCDNCGAVLVDGKCEYCGSVWFVKQGEFLPSGAYITSTKTECCSLFEDYGRSMDGKMCVAPRRREWSLDISLVGLTDETIHDLMKKLKEKM